jgi:hypothetical protein
MKIGIKNSASNTFKNQKKIKTKKKSEKNYLKITKKWNL